jgi:hypothetical protein
MSGFENDSPLCSAEHKGESFSNPDMNGSCEKSA